MWVKDELHKYVLEKIQFHTPSEHKDHGESYDGEIHFIHRHIKQVIIVAVFILEGRKHDGLQKFLERVPRTAGGRTGLTNLDLRTLLPKTKDYYRYSGSLSHPPCTEGITWYILKSPLYLSGFQLDQLELSQGKNNRPVQNLGQRIPLESR